MVGAYSGGGVQWVGPTEVQAYNGRGLQWWVPTAVGAYSGRGPMVGTYSGAGRQWGPTVVRPTVVQASSGGGLQWWGHGVVGTSQFLNIFIPRRICNCGLRPIVRMSIRLGCAHLQQQRLQPL